MTSFASIVPSSPAADQRRVQVQMTFTPITPLIATLWGGGSLSLTAQATMPTILN